MSAQRLGGIFLFHLARRDVLFSRGGRRPVPLLDAAGPVGFSGNARCYGDLYAYRKFADTRLGGRNCRSDAACACVSRLLQPRRRKYGVNRRPSTGDRRRPFHAPRRAASSLYAPFGRRDSLRLQGSPLPGTCAVGVGPPDSARQRIRPPVPPQFTGRRKDAGYRPRTPCKRPPHGSLHRPARLRPLHRRFPELDATLLRRQGRRTWTCACPGNAVVPEHSRAPRSAATPTFPGRGFPCKDEVAVHCGQIKNAKDNARRRGAAPPPCRQSGFFSATAPSFGSSGRYRFP